MGRTRRKINLLEITGITAVPGESLTIAVSAATLNDGEIYDVQLSPGVALPVGLTGGEITSITVAGVTDTIIVGDRRSRHVLSERVKRYSVIRMLYTASSVIGTTATATPVFVAFAGVARIP
jgi:hypothetical protein